MSAAKQEPCLRAAVGVRELAESVHRRGDIHARYEGSATAAEGIAAQRRAQQGRPQPYRREAPVTATVQRNGLALVIKGRIDGLHEPAALVEEFKTTRANPEALHGHLGHLHWAQLKLYAAMADRERDGGAAWTLRLVYLHPAPGSERAAEWQLERQAHGAELAAWFDETVNAYAAQLMANAQRIGRRNAELRAMPFPHPQFRAGQRRLAASVFRACRDAGQLLAEAPTGSGKTAATLFGALQAMAHGHIDRIVFATARTTGQIAAEAALAACKVQQRLATVTITAKRRICFNPELPCDPAHCQFARGYYDRMPAARTELLAGGRAGRPEVEAAARRHQLCPFELSVDTAAWADVVICDYNYVFDPIVGLSRLRAAPLNNRVGLLVDEAHQLGERAREMLSASFFATHLERARLDAPGALRKRLDSVRRAVATLRHAAPSAIDPPQALLRALTRLLNAAAETDAGHRPPLRDFLGDCARFVRSADWFASEDYRYLLRAAAGEVEVRMACLSPAAHLKAALGSFHGAARFSGTVSPLPLFQRMHGQPQDAGAMRVDAGFPADALGVFIAADIPTYYRQRTASKQGLARLIAAVAMQAPGPSLAAFPSFEYLEAAVAELRCMCGLPVEAQRRDMTGAERREFIQRLSQAGKRRIGAVALGGAFAESVDFGGGALKAVVVVGPGLAPRSAEQDLIAARFGPCGFDVAYLQPAMTRVAQAAGRAVRGPDDRGMVVLVDPRFAEHRCRAYFPPHWQPKALRGADIGGAAAAFWAAPGARAGDNL